MDKSNVSKLHNCPELPANVSLYLMYSPVEVRWYMRVVNSADDNHYTMTFSGIKYCPYCGELLPKGE